MKTDFTILWVDDKMAFIQSLTDILEDWLEDKGFGLEVLPHVNHINVIRDLQSNDVDLIIIDYNIPNSDNGDVIIEEIRKNDFFQDIIFYTENRNAPWPPIHRQFDGVFFVSKQDAQPRIQEIIELKLKKLINPIYFRGWVVADSIELEGLISEILNKCIIERDGMPIFKRILGDALSRPIFDFNGKHMLLNGLLKDYLKFLNSSSPREIARIENLKACKSKLDNFVDDVIHIRNALAHQRLDEMEFGKQIKTKSRTFKTLSLEEETFIKIRITIREHRENLENLHLLLS